MKTSIIETLRSFVTRDSIDLAMTAALPQEATNYLPIGKYIHDLQIRTKPETASEDLFRGLAKDVLGVTLFSQVNTGDGFVDFIIPEINGEVLIELKPLFHRYDDLELRSHPVKPQKHLTQVKKYLHKHEYVILTDLKDAFLFSARDTLVDGTYFARLPFAELLERHAESRSLLDVMRRAEDGMEKPELERQFFEDLREWFGVFQGVAFINPASKELLDAPASAELIILLINKLIFAKTLEDHGLVAYRLIQDDYERQKERWEAKGAPSTIRSFLRELEEFFDEYYDTELFERKIWDYMERSRENIERFARALDLVLGISKWDKVFSRGIVHYNYRRINEDIFGKGYEMFLAANRKDEDIYYTPATITIPMADSLVATLFVPLVDKICAAVHQDRCDFDTANALMQELTNLRIADTAAGSGGFLIKVLHAIWAQYLRLDAACDWARQFAELVLVPQNVKAAIEFRRSQAFDTRRILVARIVQRHLACWSASDVLAEVAKANIWRSIPMLLPAEFNFRLLGPDSVPALPPLAQRTVFSLAAKQGSKTTTRKSLELLLSS